MSKVIKEIIIRNRKGLHARASAEVVRLAESFKTPLSIYCQGMCAPANSIMDLLMLGAGQGTLLRIEGNGKDAEHAVAALINLIENEFGET